ncbi:DUF5317 family protein [Petroclostridium xylanilyticum]|jgi:hypothetical protein|uniref:DUF5317 family protein n=1 Tax=Petroclostridium xylanilyticum TaxID=1792311 RepID=UPI000B99654D|nr:DUF5317 family protein [Petroclostridium xylanilyticum]
MLKSQMVITHTLITSSTRLSILADIIAIPKPYPLPKVLSIGDIFIAFGVFVFIQEAMLSRRLIEKNIIF